MSQVPLPAIVGDLPDGPVSSASPESILANLKNFARLLETSPGRFKNIVFHMQLPVGRVDISSEAMENHLKKILAAIG